MGNTRVRPAVYNPATGTYTTAPALNTTALKSKHLANIPPAASVITTPPADIDMLDEDPEADISAQPKPTLDEDRTFTVRKWVLVPAAEADKRPEPKYLADRRPGLKSLYRDGQVANVDPAATNVSANGATLGALANAAGEEISSTGLELSTVGDIGMGASVSTAVSEPPRRRGPPPPPKRKRKGGVGRRKKVLIDQTQGEQRQGNTGVDGTAEQAGTGGEIGGIKSEGLGDAEAGTKGGEEEDGSGSDDSDEGSEEGEIDEGDIVMNANVADEVKELQNHAGESTPQIAEAGEGHDVSRVEVAGAASRAMTEVAQVEPRIGRTGQQPEDLAAEIVPLTVPETSNLVAKETLPTTVAADGERTTVPASMMPVPRVAKPDVEDAEVDLLGSLDRAVEGMQGANADTVDGTERQFLE